MIIKFFSHYPGLKNILKPNLPLDFFWVIKMNLSSDSSNPSGQSGSSNPLNLILQNPSRPIANDHNHFWLFRNPKGNEIYSNRFPIWDEKTGMLFITILGVEKDTTSNPDLNPKLKVVRNPKYRPKSFIPKQTETDENNEWMNSEFYISRHENFIRCKQYLEFWIPLNRQDLSWLGLEDTWHSEN